jgi:hypothetical protein
MNEPVGSHCTVTEGTMPPLPPGCHWLAPSYSPASVTIASGLNQETVTNGYRCEIMTGSLTLKKEGFHYTSSLFPNLTFPITVTCGGTSTNLTLVEGVPQTISNIPLNSSCTVVEGPVTTPANACPAGTAPVWTTVYVPPSPIIITGTGVTEIVQNTMNCNPTRPNVCPPQQVANVDGICACPPPLVPAPVAGTCICPPGTALVGGKCVTPGSRCPPPLVPNAAGICGCPPGTVLRGRECVRPIVCQPPLVPNAAGTGCVCRAGLVFRGGMCVEPDRNPRINIPGGMPGPGGGGMRR